MKQTTWYLILLMFLPGCHFCMDEFRIIGEVITLAGTALVVCSCHIHSLIHKWFKKGNCKH